MVTDVLALRAPPVTVTLVPTAPVTGERARETVTVKTTVGAVPAVTAYEPAGIGGTVKVAVNEPDALALADACWVPLKAIAIPGASAPKPRPVTFT
jgi:hypothetical protein